MSNGSYRSSTLLATCLAVGLLVFFWVQTPAPLHSDSVTGHGRPPPAYDRPGTLSIHPDRLDGNLTGDAIPYWAPFDATDLDEGHGRLLETLFLAASRVERIVSPLPATEVETVLFFGDSNERGIVDELCIKLGSWPKIISAKNPPATSDLWHADPHVCEIELREQGRKLRLASFMSYGVLIERDSQLWDKKLELDHGPWAIEERIELAREFVDQMAWGKIDLVIFNSNLWDLMYLHDTHLRLKTAYEFSLSTSTLESYVSRASFALTRIKASFPTTRVYVRTLHPLHPGRPIDFFNSRRVSQINQATLEVVARRNGASEREEVRLLDVGKVLEGWPTTNEGGHNILKDKVHLGWNPGLWMYGEMVLDALARSRL